ncbi:MAG TPA: hypothetical protein VFV81_00225 [Verrucomicrobiae bacterium]|nr:hypothetical protein [Verrucomicrobiae bacterium]
MNATMDSTGRSNRIAGIYLFQFLALALFAWGYWHNLNTDAVAYLQIAADYSTGKFGLAISDYWSPLFSWLLVPFLKAGWAPLAAARLVMIISAIVFLAGCHRFFAVVELAPAMRRAGLWIAALLSLPWSIENITPDLLSAGLIAFAFAETIRSRAGLNAWLAGLLWGAAYLGKSVALPLGILTVAGVAAWSWQKESLKRIVAGAALAGLGIFLVAAPWIAVISVHDGHLAVAKSAHLNHALVGPEISRPRFLLDQGFKAPPPGRLTIWEDPSLPYPDWSPFSSGNNAVHQLRVLLGNVPVALIMLTGISLAFPLLLLRALVSPLSSKSIPGFHRALLPVWILAALFLPNYLLITEQRYFYGVTPMLLVATMGMLSASRVARVRAQAALILTILFLVPTVAREAWHLSAIRRAGEDAHLLAERISGVRPSVIGPIAGSGRISGGRPGLYTAFLLQQPWYGDDPAATAATFEHSGAKLVIVDRHSAMAQQLAAYPADFRNLDAQLFPAGAGDFPLQVFENLQSGAGRVTSP